MNSPDKQFKVAVITQVFNEDVFLPVWLNHYGPLFGYENLIVIDDGSDDGSTRDPRIRNLVKKKRAPLDETDRSLLISLFHESLLSHFDAVIYTDCDELIVVDPDCKSTLFDYLRKTSWSTMNVMGFHVLHSRSAEKKLDWSTPLFNQRHFAMFERGYCKPLVSKEPIRWRPGFHKSDKLEKFDSNLIMFHLRSVDYDYSSRRIKLLNKVEFSRESLEMHHGSQFRLPESAFLKMLYDDVEEGISKVSDLDFKDVLTAHSKDTQFNKTVLRIPGRFKDTVQLNAEHDVAPLPQSSLSHGSIKVTQDGLQDIFEACLDKVIFARERSRTSICPCGSNLRYKHCHGAYRS